MFAFGALQWTPEVFWACTISDFEQATKGYNRANGLTDPEYMTRETFEEMMERFPDVNNS